MLALSKSSNNTRSKEQTSLLYTRKTLRCDNCYQSEHCVDSTGNASINNRPKSTRRNRLFHIVRNSSYALGKQIKPDIIVLQSKSDRADTPSFMSRIALQRIAWLRRHYGELAIKCKRQNSLTFTLIAQFASTLSSARRTRN